MTKLVQFAVYLVLAVAASNGLPVEDQAPLVVDVPAVPSSASNSREEVVQKPVKEPEVISIREPSVIAIDDNDSVEVLPIPTSQDSDEFDVGSRVHSIFDLFNLRPMNRPQTPIFTFHRRPVIRDPFADFDDRVEVVRPTQTQNVFVREPEQQRPTNSFDFMRHMDMMMQRVQQQLNNFMGFAHSHIQPAPAAPRPHSSFPRPIFPSFFDIHRGSADNETESGEVINLDTLPANYSNSTSEIKEIDGQQVQVNKTIKRVSSGNGSSFFQLSVINYRPRGTTGKPAVAEVEVEATPAAASSEIVTKQPETPAPQVTEDVMKPEDPMMNEIDQLEGQRQTNEAGDFPFLLNRFKGQYEVEKPAADKKTGETAELMQPTVEVVPLPEQRRSQRMAYSGGDLSGDILVNKLMAEQLKQAHIRMVHPDVELIDV